MNIGIDIDDTISDTFEEVVKYGKIYTKNILNKEFNIDIKKKIENPLWAKELFDWSNKEDRKFWNLYYEDIIKNVKPKENAAEVINELAKDNNIVIITARFEQEGNIEKATKKWLEDNNIKYNKFFMGHLDKREIALENNIDIFIDDSYTTCKEINSINIKTIIMNSNLNEIYDDQDLIRVYSWKEINEIIKKECIV